MLFLQPLLQRLKSVSPYVQDLVSGMLNAAAADACSKLQTLAQALVCEAEACQHSAIMIASLTTSWTPFMDEQLEHLAEAGAVDGLVR